MANTDVKRPETEARARKKWTVMVYMAAGDSAELDAVAVEDLKEMEQGANDHAHVVVQINRAWPTVPQRYRIGPSKSELLKGDEIVHTNMGRGETLAEFLKWAAPLYPADHYCLVLWGHAFGLGFGRDHNDPLKLPELRIALDAFAEKRAQRLELLGTNACAMSYVEAAFELRKSASYLVASQIAVPFTGWPYKTILSRIDGSTGPVGLGQLIVDAYVTHYNASLTSDRVQMSLLKLDEAEILSRLLEEFTKAVRTETLPNDRFSSDRFDYVRDVFMAAAAGDVRPLIDLRDLCRGFEDAKCEALKALSEHGAGALKKLVLHERAHPDLDDLHGVGIFVPFVTDEQDLKRLGLQNDDGEQGTTDASDGRRDPQRSGREEYDALSIFEGKASGWPRLVYDELRREIPSEIMTNLTTVGATRRADRRDITQIVLSIEASFNKLDRVIAEARTCIADDLEAASNGDARGSQGEDIKIRKNFGPPWLRLIRPLDLEARVTMLQQLEELRRLEGNASTEAIQTGAMGARRTRLSSQLAGGGASIGQGGADSSAGSTGPVSAVVGFFQRVEKAVGDVERATRKGLTNAKFGLGPTAPGQFNSGFGDSSEQPKSELGDSSEQPKSELGPADRRTNNGLSSRGDLRVDLAFERVSELFRSVGGALQELEEATLEVESIARDMLSHAEIQNLSGRELLLAAQDEIDRAFRILQDASVNARRTVRRVLAHPIYGVGPTSGGAGLEDRQALARAGGLDRRNLRLL